MGVEVDDPERPVAVHPGEPGPISVRDRVVAAEHDGHGARRSDRSDGVGERLETLLQISGGRCDVADVHDRQHRHGIDAGRQVGSGPVRTEVVGLADGLGPESGAAAIRRAPVDRRPDDDHVGGMIGDGLEGHLGDACEGREGRKPVDPGHCSPSVAFAGWLGLNHTMNDT